MFGPDMAMWTFFIGLAVIFEQATETGAVTVMPTITCHDDFNVTITSGSWELIAVEGYELLNVPDPMCVSQSKFGELHFDIQRHCHNGANTMTVFNNTYTFTLRARQEWLVETSEDRLIEMKCEYHLTGEGQFEQPVTAQQEFTVAPTVSATRATVIQGAKLLLVNARDDADGSADQVWTNVDTVKVGQKVRLVVDTTTTPTYSQYPYIGVIGCYFYDREDANAMRFDMVSTDGCNNPPSYYDPFKAGGTPFVNGMWLNIKPVDDANTSPAENPVTDATGYLTGAEEPGVAYSDVFKIFKFPGSNEIRAKCKIRFCVEKSDPNCITPNCNERLYTGLYSLGGYSTVFNRKKRSAIWRQEDEEETESRKRRSVDGENRDEEVGEIGFVIKIVDVGDGTKQISASSSELEMNSSGDVKTAPPASSCGLEFHLLIALCVILAISILAFGIILANKKSQQIQEERNFYSSSNVIKH